MSDPIQHDGEGILHSVPGLDEAARVLANLSVDLPDAHRRFDWRNGGSDELTLQIWNQQELALGLCGQILYACGGTIGLQAGKLTGLYQLGEIVEAASSADAGSWGARH